MEKKIIELQLEEDPKSGYSVYGINWPNLATVGADLEDALFMARDCAETWYSIHNEPGFGPTLPEFLEGTSPEEWEFVVKEIVPPQEDED